MTQDYTIIVKRNNDTSKLVHLARQCIGVIHVETRNDIGEGLVSVIATVHGVTQAALRENVYYVSGYLHGLKKAFSL